MPHACAHRPPTTFIRQDCAGAAGSRQYWAVVTGCHAAVMIQYSYVCLRDLGPRRPRTAGSSDRNARHKNPAPDKTLEAPSRGRGAERADPKTLNHEGVRPSMPETEQGVHFLKARKPTSVQNRDSASTDDCLCYNA